MDMAAYAVKQANVNVHHLFASESCPHIREHLARNHDIDTILKCLLKRPNEPYRGVYMTDSLTTG